MRKITISSIALVAFVLFCSPLAHAGKGPDWVNGQSSKYPEPRYFIGVGTAQLDKGGPKQQLEWAGDRARAEIAKTLRVNVDVSEHSERNIESKGAGSAREMKTSSQQREVVATSANELLEGVEIKEYYKNKKEKMVYALAVLDRHKAAQRLEANATRVKEDLLAAVEEGERLQGEKRILPAIGQFRKAYDLAGEVSRIDELIGILRPAGPSHFAEGTSRQADLKRILDGLRRQLRFEVAVEGPAAGIRPYLIQGLAKAGYVTTGAASGAGLTYKLLGKTDLTYRGTIDMGKDMLMQIYQADLDLEVVDPATGETAGALTFSASANEKQAPMAEKSAVRALGRYVQEHIADKLAELL